MIAVKQKIRSNLKTESNQNGVLLQEEKAYMQCLQLQVKDEQLNEILTQDDLQWRQAVVKKRNKFDRKQRKLVAALAEA